MLTSPSSSGSAGSGSSTTVTYSEPYSANLLSSSLNIPSNNTSVDLGVRLTPGKTVHLCLSTTANDRDSANLVSCVLVRIIEGMVGCDTLAADNDLAVHACELGLATPSGSGHSSIRMVRGLRPLKLVEVRYLQGLPITPADVTTLPVPQTSRWPSGWPERGWRALRIPHCDGRPRSWWARRHWPGRTPAAPLQTARRIPSWPPGEVVALGFTLDEGERVDFALPATALWNLLHLLGRQAERADWNIATPRPSRSVAPQCVN